MSNKDDGIICALSAVSKLVEAGKYIKSKKQENNCGRESAMSGAV